MEKGDALVIRAIILCTTLFFSVPLFAQKNMDVLFMKNGDGRHLNTNATYFIKVVNDLSWNVSLYGSWDSRPPATFPKSDYDSSSGLSWTFGNR
jgi:hypothetical protein